AGPVTDGFSMWSLDTRATNSIYMAVLPKGVVSPLAKESDEEGKKRDESAEEKKTDEAAKPEAEAAKSEEKPAAGAKKQPAKTVVDLDGLSQRIVSIPLPPAVYSNLQVGKSGELYYEKRTDSGRGERRPGSLARYTLSKRKEDILVEKMDDFELSRDSKRVLRRVPENNWSIADVGEKIDPTKMHKLAVENIEVKIDPSAEWRQIFEEAWRINRDYFYDPNMHGADWNAMKAKYSPLLADVTDR